MYFIKNIARKLSASRKKLSAFSYQLLAFRKPTTKSQQLKAILSAFRNLPPRLVGGQATIYHPASSAGRLQPKKGFTLIETLVAISILMIAIASPLTIAQKGVASAIYAKDQIIASYLAQDAIEFLINKSDGNKLSGAGWLDGIKDECEENSSCQIDTVTVNGTIENCISDGCDKLKYSDTYHSYSYGDGNLSEFTRSVVVEEVNSNTEALITVKMFWLDKSKPRTLTFQTRIFNWK